MSNSSIRPLDRTLSSATTPDLREPGSDDNEEVLRISQRSRITRSSPLDCLMSTGHFLGVLTLCRDAVGIFYTPSRLRLPLYTPEISC